MSTALLLTAVVAAAAAAALTAGWGARPLVPAGGRFRGVRLLVPVLGVLGVTALGGGHEGRHLALLGVLAVAVLGAARVAARGRRDQAAQRRRLAVVDYCEALAGELRAGQPVVRAVERAAQAWPEADAVAAAARLGASVPEALHRLASQPGAATVRRLAGAWEISAGTGSSLVLAVEQVLATARSEDGTARLVRAELASARATARLVTVLPLVVLVAAQGIGAQPWQFLLDTTAGVGCLAGGVVLSLLGLGWIDRIAAASTEGAG